MESIPQYCMTNFLIKNICQIVRGLLRLRQAGGKRKVSVVRERKHLSASPFEGSTIETYLWMIRTKQSAPQVLSEHRIRSAVLHFTWYRECWIVFLCRNDLPASRLIPPALPLVWGTVFQLWYHEYYFKNSSLILDILAFLPPKLPALGKIIRSSTLIFVYLYVSNTTPGPPHL